MASLLRVRPNFRAFNINPSKIRVACPRSVLIPRLQALQLAESLDCVKQIIDSHGEKLPLQIRIPIDLNAVKQEIGQNIYLGQTFYYGLLAVSEIKPSNIILVQNPRLQFAAQHTLLSTAQNLRERRTSLTEGTPDVSVKQIVEGDFAAILAVLAKDNVQSIKTAITNGTFDEILTRLDQETRTETLALLEQGEEHNACHVISEWARNKLIEDIRQSNLIENIKVPLLHILAEREAVYLSMFSFTSPIFAAALVATWQRGAEVKVLLDSREAKQSYSQYENLADYAKERGFELRIFSTTHQHLKNIVCVGQQVIIMGSQNLSLRAFTSNLEDLVIISGDRESFDQKAGDFNEIFDRQGEFVPLPAEIAERHYIWRTGLQGIRFLEKTPPPQVVEDIFKRLAELKPGDYEKLKDLLEFAKGKKMELVHDLTQVFHPFMAEIRDPILVDRLLPEFLADVPIEFCWKPVHRGTTTGISTLVERTLLVLEYGIMICKHLGKKDLLDQFSMAAIACDAYGRDGRLAAEALFKKIVNLEGWERYQEGLTTLYTVISERMEPDKGSQAVPLREVDSMLRIIAAIARDLAKKKYLYLDHRVAQKRTIHQILDAMLTNSYSIGGEGLAFLQKDPEIAKHIPRGPMPRRAQKMLRVAESLCDRFGYTDETDRERHEILLAVLLQGWGVSGRKTYNKPKSAQDPAVHWIVSIAELIAAHQETWVLTEDEVSKHLSEAKLPDTQWKGRRLKASNESLDLSALMLKANGITSLEDEISIPARDRKSLKEYKYLPTIADAVKTIYPILETEERIDIYGDYDIDGQAGTAILVKSLRWLRAKMLHRKLVLQGMKPEEARKEAIKIAEETIGYYIPHKINEGYGLNDRAIERLHDRGTKLLITVDCGVNDKKAVAKAKQLDMEVVVTDHHSISKQEQMPADTIIINPKIQLEADHPAHDLAGAGVAYKLALALADRGEINLGDNFLDLVAVALLADKVAMLGENRAFTFFGMKRLVSGGVNRGLAAIMRGSKEPLNEGLITGALAPKFDVLGRIGMPTEGVDLLLSRDNNVIRKIVSLMNDSERDRKKEEDKVVKAVREKLAFDPAQESAVAISGQWDRGMVSVIASKLAKEHGVPALVVTTSGLSDYIGAANPASGSIRTLGKINPLNILKQCDDIFQAETDKPLFLSYGGHYRRSAGFRIEEANIADMLRIYRQVTKELKQPQREKIVYHARLKEGEISLADFKEFRKRLGPFGPGFEMPKFLVVAQVVSWRVFGKNFQHIKGVLKGGTKFIIYDGNKPWVKRVLMENKGKVKMIVSLGIDLKRRLRKTEEELVFVVEDLK